jgi:antitoxin component YwqK of YwqJK toxin-antitoxin module
MMKKHFWVVPLILVFACNKQETSENTHSTHFEIPQIFELKSSSNITLEGDTVYLNHKKYTGFLFELYPNKKDTAILESYHNGLLTGLTKKWYANKILMEERYFEAGKKNGKQTAYWENGKKKFEYMAKKDVYEGEMTEWAPNGEINHIGNYVNGQEEGSQKMWYENGKIRANYIIRNGKRFGLLGTKNCKNVSDSIFVVR